MKKTKKILISISLLFFLLGNSSGIHAEQNQNSNVKAHNQIGNLNGQNSIEESKNMEIPDDKTNDNSQEENEASAEKVSDNHQSKLNMQESSLEDNYSESEPYENQESDENKWIGENNDLEETPGESLEEENQEKTIETEDTKLTVPGDSEMVQPAQAPGLIDANILNNTDLDVQSTTLENGNVQITLTYSGRGIINLSLLSNTYIIFKLPNAIMNRLNKEDITRATYDVPKVSIIIPIFRDTGEFDDEEIILDKDLNQIYMSIFSLLSLNLLSIDDYIFTLTFELDELPTNEMGEYNFYAEMTSQLVDLNILSNTSAHDTLQAPILLDSPTIEPVYSNDEVVKGTGIPNTTINLLINNEVYRGDVDTNGNYTVEIPRQDVGTVISARLTDEADNRSAVVDTTVQQATLSFHYVPETLSFQTTPIETGVLTVSRENPDWSIEIRDTRGEGSTFQVTAEVENPMASTDGNHGLTDALVFIDEEGNSQSLSRGAVPVYSGITGSNRITTVSWEENQGPMIQVHSSDVRATTYETTITWSLIDGPF